MRQFIAIFAAFLLMPLLIKGIPLLTKKKPGFGPVLLITGVCLALIAGLPVATAAESFASIFTTMKTVQIIVAIILVGVLGNLLKQYGFLDRIVAALETLIPSKKAILMVLPAVMGILTVPGGAYLSAPFVDKIGDDLELSAPRKVVVNLSFRHVALFIMPFTTNMLFIPTVVPEINIYHLITLNVGFILCMHTAAYFIYLHRAKSVRVQTGGSKKKAVLDLLLYLSPIYLVVFFNGLFHLPMYLSVALCILWMLFLCWKEKKTFFRNLWKGISFSTLFMLIGVYFIQNLIQNLDQVMNRGSMAVPEQFRLWYHAGDFRRVAAVWPDHRIKSGSHRYHPSFGGYASDGSDLEAFVYLLCVYLVFYGVLLLSAASVPAFDCQVHGMRHLAGLQRTFENHSLAVCILLLTIYLYQWILL